MRTFFVAAADNKIGAKAAGLDSGMSRKGLGTILVAGCVLLAGTVSHAATVQALTLKDRVLRAPVIVRGVVQKIEAKRKGPWVVTDVTVAVERALKGWVKDEVTIRTLGGRMGKRITYVPGSSTFVAGEEVLVFLERGGEGSLVEQGIGTGKFSIFWHQGEPWVRWQSKTKPSPPGIDIDRDFASRPLSKFEQQIVDLVHQ